MTDEREEQVIEESDVGSADEVLGLGEETAEAPESVPEAEVEKVTDIEMGKTPEELKPKFLSLYKVLSDLGDTVDHGASSKRHHFKVGRKGYGLLFYGMKPKLQLCHVKERIKKKQFTTYSITERGPFGADENLLTVKEIQKIVRAYKKARNL